MAQGFAWHVDVYEEEGGGYWGEVREMPGCLSQGDTMDELRANMTEAIEAFYPVFLEDGGVLRPACASTEIVLRVETRELASA